MSMAASGLGAGHSAVLSSNVKLLAFQAVPPAARRNVLERFYQLPEPSIARFYALTTTAFDRARILCGRPPRGLSLGRAVTKGLFQ